ncbi:hypothetical protein HIM_04231 [Hirsutella minnesotensis 3608]|uniref:Peptide hydrolase n=1 Tax=Hirsutella minnesotensis 3608 TaxID=1043627 RepID=A0A0F8A1T7_9HYPO|nr:hypothetical protein HIM_04231 [Hirsutella minnesotensis 3608]
MKLLGAVFTIAVLVDRTVAHGHPRIHDETVVKEIGHKDLVNTLGKLYRYAERTTWSRAFGEQGYKLSVDMVLRGIKQCGNNIMPRVQTFTYLYERTNDISIIGPECDRPRIISLQWNSGTRLPGGVSGSMIGTPVDDERGSACFEDQWNGINATGKIALVKRGVCAIADKVKLAMSKGAIAVLVWHHLPGHVTQGTLGFDNAGNLVPVGVINNTVGDGWSRRLLTGEDMRVKLIINHTMEERESWNVIADTRRGSQDSIIMLGAHLDSVQAGPGINDNGSGSSALIEIMQKSCLTTHRSRIRYAWWGAEELGMIGSTFYANNLTQEEAEQIRFYYNFDMIGSRKAEWTVYASNEADKFGAKYLYEFLKDSRYVRKHAQNVTYQPFGSTSDHVPFRKLGIPSSGLFSGAGPKADVCNHQFCDDVRNVDHWNLLEATRAAGHAMANMAILHPESLPARKGTTMNPKEKRSIETDRDELIHPENDHSPGQQPLKIWQRTV